MAVSFRSVASGVRLPVVSPRRSATRNTCVSTAIAGRSKTTERMTLAVFRPTPGRERRLSISAGTSPPKSSTSFDAIPFSALALLFGYDTDFIYSRICSTPAAAIVAASGKAANSAGVTALIRLSVHCADSITAVSNSKGLLYDSSVFGSGISRAKRSTMSR